MIEAAICSIVGFFLGWRLRGSWDAYCIAHSNVDLDNLLKDSE